MVTRLLRAAGWSLELEPVHLAAIRAAADTDSAVSSTCPGRAKREAVPSLVHGGHVARRGRGQNHSNARPAASAAATTTIATLATGTSRTAVTITRKDMDPRETAGAGVTTETTCGAVAARATGPRRDGVVGRRCVTRVGDDNPERPATAIAAMASDTAKSTAEYPRRTCGEGFMRRSNVLPECGPGNPAVTPLRIFPASVTFVPTPHAGAGHVRVETMLGRSRRVVGRLVHRLR
jgi:hypothetical protein